MNKCNGQQIPSPLFSCRIFIQLQVQQVSYLIFSSVIELSALALRNSPSRWDATWIIALVTGNKERWQISFVQYALEGSVFCSSG